jgi:hypothetical protein
MLGIGFRQIDPLGEAHPRIEPLGLAEAIPRAVNIEEVLCGGTHERRLGSPCQDVIGMVHSESDLPVDVLLGILWADRLTESPKATQVAARRGACDPLIQRHQIARQSPASGVAGAANSLRVDLFPTLEVVDRSHSVPDSKGSRVAAQQGTAHANQAMRGCASHQRLALSVEQLVTFALFDRIVAERGHAVLGQQDTHPLVDLAGLAVAAVPAGNEHAWVGRLRLGKIEIGRDEMTRLTFEDDVLDSVAVVVGGANDMRAQRRPLGKIAQSFQE